jgi:signal transduction histidine kinase
MTPSLQNIDKLAALIQRERNTLMAQWREQVRQLPSAKHLDTPTLNDHIPTLLDELAAALRAHSGATIPEALREGSPPAHGLQRAEDGFDIEEVVAEYNILRGCIHDLAESKDLSLKGKAFHILNRVLDGAIGLAVQTYSARQAQEVQQRREEYLAFVAHDLRTPLNAISLTVKVLERGFQQQSANADISRMMKALQRNVQYLDGLVRKIIDENANLQADSGVKLQRRAVDLWPLVESLVQNLQPVAASASTRLVNHVPDELVIYADAGLLTRVFHNLVANAIKYAPLGQVAIGAKELGADGAVECWVADNGTGIPADLLPHVFDKGEADAQSDGAGLGLAIVKMFIEAHGGIVSVESTASVGSTFRFSIPGRLSAA